MSKLKILFEMLIDFNAGTRTDIDEAAQVLAPFVEKFPGSKILYLETLYDADEAISTEDDADEEISTE